MIARNFVITISVATLFFKVSCLSAEDPPCSTRTVLVNVLDKKGLPVEGLGRDNFRAKYHGQTVEITSVTRDAGPRRLVLLLDLSASMQDKWKWKTEQTLAADAVRQNTPGTSFALALFGSEVEDQVNFTQGLEPLAKKLIELPNALQAIRSKGHQTAIYDAVQEALDGLSPAREGDAIYLLTDGLDNHSKRSSGQVEPALLSARVRMFAFLFPELSMGRTAMPTGRQEGPDRLTALVKHTGGALTSFGTDVPTSYLTLPDPEMARAVSRARGLYPLMRESYRLKIENPPNVDKPSDWNLEVLDEKGKKAHYDLIYPRLAPCAAHEP